MSRIIAAEILTGGDLTDAGATGGVRDLDAITIPAGTVWVAIWHQLNVETGSAECVLIDLSDGEVYSSVFGAAPGLFGLEAKGYPVSLRVGPFAADRVLTLRNRKVSADANITKGIIVLLQVYKNPADADFGAAA